MSRNHCSIIREDFGNYKLFDNKSLNGVYHNFIRIKKSKIEDGDIISIGPNAMTKFGERIIDKSESDKLFPIKENGISENLPINSNNIVLESPKIQQQNLSSPTSTISSNFPPTPVPNSNFNSPFNITPSKQIKLEDLINGSLIFRLKITEKAERKRKREEEEEEELKEMEKKRRKFEEEMLEEKKKLKQLKNDTVVNDEIEIELRCVICQETIMGATTLPCSHNFCRTCLIDWLKTVKKDHGRDHFYCPTCRTKISRKPIRNYTLDSIITKITPYLSQDEQKRRKERVEKELEDEQISLNAIAALAQTALHKKMKFMKVNEQWNERNKSIFNKGMINYKGKARKQYLEYTGLTPEFIEKGTSNEIKIAIENLNLNINFHQNTNVSNFNPLYPNGQFNLSLARELLTDFLNNEYIDLC